MTEGSKPPLDEGTALTTLESLPERLAELTATRYILLRGKKPLERRWQADDGANYPANHHKIKTHVASGGNVGLLTGTALGNGDYLVVVDADTPEVEERLSTAGLPETFTVRSGGKKLAHYYYKVDRMPESKKYLDAQKNTLLDFQAKGNQIVVPPSSIKREDGRVSRYEVANPAPIARVPLGELLARLEHSIADLLPPKHLTTIPASRSSAVARGRPSTRGGPSPTDAQRVKEALDFKETLARLGVDVSRQPTMCPLGHTSKGGRCFSWQGPNPDLWRCHHCGEAGDIFTLYMLRKRVGFREALAALAEQAGVELTPRPPPAQQAAASFGLLDAARRFIERQPLYYDEPPTGKGVFWLWNHDAYRWEMRGETDLLRLLEESEGLGELSVQRKRWYVDALKHVGVGNKPAPLAWEWVQFHDRLLNVRTGEERAATPRDRCTNPIPWRLGDSEETPTLDRLLRDWVGEPWDQTLRELLAYACLRKLPIHTLVWLVGKGSNGKGRYLTLLKRFLGRENIATTELPALERSRFETFKLYQKLAVTIGETDADSIRQSGRLKALTGEDLVGYEVKNGPLWDAESYALPIISTNNVPLTTDESAGWWRRQLVVEFPNTFPDGRDILDEVPQAEYRNLARRVSKLLPAILEARTIANRGTIEQRRERYLRVSNPLPLFIAERYEQDDDCTVDYGIMFKEYREWLKHRRLRARQMSKRLFSKQLDHAGIEHTRGSRRTGEDVQRTHWVVGFRPKAEGGADGQRELL